MKTLFSKIQANQTLILVLACVLVRLPFLCYTPQPLDPDECVIGLMAKHAAEGRNVPLFFYGQSYGFAWIEYSLVRVFYAFLGVNDLAVRLPMLLMFTLGVVLHYKTLQNILKSKNTETDNTETDSTETDSDKILFQVKNVLNYLPFLFGLLFAFAPTWAIWSLKARGGYLTAFLLFGVMTYIFTDKAKVQKRFLHLLLGVLLVIIFQAQPLFLVGLLPILTYYGYQNIGVDSAKSYLFIVLKVGVGVGLAFLFFTYTKQGLPDFWQPKVFSLDFFNWHNIDTRIKETLSGSYDFYYQQPFFMVSLWANLVFYLAVIAVITSFVFFIKKEKISLAFYFFIVATLLTLVYKLFISNESPRYLLPLYTYLSFVFFAITVHIFKNYPKYNRLGLSVLCFLLLLGGAATLSFCNQNLGSIDKKSLILLINQLKKQQTTYIFSTDGVLSWQIIFYSKQQIISRTLGYRDRCPQYVAAVDSMAIIQPARTALIANASDTMTCWSPNISFSYQKLYYIHAAPSENLRKQYHFSTK